MRRAFGPYEVEQELARGGMGVVYAVRHRETGVRYALKTISSAFGPVEGEELDRFRREADLMSRLDHPGIVKVHTYGTEAGAAYLVQSFLPGGSLQDRLRERGRLPREEAVALVADLADAVQHAHDHHVLHRDLKPHNVLLDEEGRVVLVDFGLGRDLSAESRRMTETGQVMGTPGYMAPEQVQGERRDDPRTDVYGLGAILFALLTGCPPFTGQGLGVLAAIVHDSAPDVSAIEPETPPALAATIARCLAKRPGDRFPTAAALARVLRSGEAPSSPDGPSAAVGSGLALTAVALIAGLGLLLARTTPAPSRAPTPVVRDPLPAEEPPTVTSRADWETLLSLIDTQPDQAWNLLQQWGAPPPGVSETLEQKLRRPTRRLNRRVKQAPFANLTSAVDERLGRHWLASLRLRRKLQPDHPFPADHVDALPRAILTFAQRGASSFPRAKQHAFVLEVIDLLGAQHVPGLPQALAGYTHRLEDDVARRLVIPRFLPVWDTVPREAADWLDAQQALLTLLLRIGPLRPYRATEPEALALAKLISDRCARLSPQAPKMLYPLLRRVQAKTFLQLGDLDAAATIATLGKAKAPLCQAILASCHYRRGRREAAVKEARGFLEGRLLTSDHGKSAHVLAVGILYEERAQVGVADAARVELGKLVASAPDRHHLWALRYVHLLLAADQPDEANKVFGPLLQSARSARPGCCLDGHAAVEQVARGPVTLKRVEAALATVSTTGR